MSGLRGASLLLALVTSPAPAAALADCVALADPAQRLACYDRAAGRAADAPAAVPAPGSGFGRAPQAAPEEKEALEARIVGDFRQWKKGTRVTLDNGQVWKVTGDGDAYYPNLPRDPAVTIRRGLLRSYWMELNDIGRRVKVVRVD